MIQARGPVEFAHIGVLYFFYYLVLLKCVGKYVLLFSPSFPGKAIQIHARILGET